MGARRTVGLLCVLLGAASGARAHGFGQRYDLPLPLALYLFAAALTVAISCVMFAMFVRAAPARPGSPTPAEARVHVFGPWACSGIALLRAGAVALYALVVLAGLLGNQSPLKNVAPVMVWAVWWVGMAYVCALAADVWKLLNPLDTLYRCAAWVLAHGRSRAASRVLPPGVGVWPSVALLLAWLWMEIAWEGSDSPAAIAWVIAAYSVLTWVGMHVFGRERWLESAEVFTRVFGVLGRFAPIELVAREGRVCGWRLRPYGTGLLSREPVSASETALVVLILAAVTFDGFLETPAWAAIVEGAGTGNEAAALRTAGLVAAPMLFFAVYALFCRAIARAGGEGMAAARIVGLFVLTLVPIAIAYQVAHYLSFLVMAGQYLIPLASDPLGAGWDLFGTANHFIRPGIIDARLVWYLSLGAIIAGHVAALYLSHRLSLQEFADRRAAVRSQWPMLALMVGYTMLSLWIIAQPIVASRFG